MIIISPEEPGDAPPGSIIPWPNGQGSHMIIPSEFGLDPIAGLSDQQRAFLREGDEAIALVSAMDPDQPGTLIMGERWVTWPEGA
jgi:hypothetical protein